MDFILRISVNLINLNFSFSSCRYRLFQRLNCYLYLNLKMDNPYVRYQKDLIGCCYYYFIIPTYYHSILKFHSIILYHSTAIIIYPLFLFHVILIIYPLIINVLHLINSSLLYLFNPYELSYFII